MSQVMREELSIYGTRVVCLSPGRTATALRRTLAPDEDPTTIMQPEHVAQGIYTLCSPVGRFIDSENVVVRQSTDRTAHMDAHRLEPCRSRNFQPEGTRPAGRTGR